MSWHPEGWGWWNDDDGDCTCCPDSPNYQPPMTAAQQAEEAKRYEEKMARRAVVRLRRRVERKARSGLRSVYRIDALLSATPDHPAYRDWP